MIEPGESLYLISITLSTPSGQRISAEPFWRICGKTNPMDFAIWIADRAIDWVDILQSQVPGRLGNARMEIVANSTFFVTTSDHRVEYLRDDLTVRELQNTRHDKLVRYLRSKIKPTHDTVTFHQV